MNTRATRPLVESALLAALGAVMMLIAWYVPVIGVVVGLVSPLPAAVAVMRHGTRWGVMSSVVTMLVLAPIVGWVAALGLWVVNGAMGISFGFAVRRNYRPTMVLLTASLGSLVAMVAEFVSGYLVLGLTLEKQIDEIITMWNQAMEMNRKLLGPNPALDQFAAMAPTKEMLMGMLPAIVFMGAFMLAYVNFELFRRVLPRLGYTLEGLPPFSRWIFPVPVAAAGIISLLVYQLQGSYNIPALARVAENVYTIASMVFLVEALSAMMFYLLRSGMSRGVAGLFAFMAVSMLFSAGPLSLLVALFGMIDILFDFRHIRFEPLGEI